MKKTVFISSFVLLSFIVQSCKSDVDKANDLIKDYMFENIGDFKSYEVIDTEIDYEVFPEGNRYEYENPIVLENTQLLFGDKDYNINILLDEDNDDILRSICSALKDSINYVKVNQKYRCNLGILGTTIQNEIFIFDSNIKQILFHYMPEDKIIDEAERVLLYGPWIIENRDYFNNHKDDYDSYLTKSGSEKPEILYSIISYGDDDQYIKEDFLNYDLEVTGIDGSSYYAQEIAPNVIEWQELPDYIQYILKDKPLGTRIKCLVPYSEIPSGNFFGDNYFKDNLKYGSAIIIDITLNNWDGLHHPWLANDSLASDF